MGNKYPDTWPCSTWLRAPNNFHSLLKQTNNYEEFNTPSLRVKYVYSTYILCD